MDSEGPDGVMLLEENCEEYNVNFEEVFPDSCEQGFTDGCVEVQSSENEEIYKNAGETGYDDGYQATFMLAQDASNR